MKEVSCRVPLLFFAAFRKQGLPIEALTEGLGYSLDHLENEHERIDWSTFCRLVENAERYWSPADFEACGEDVPSSPLSRALVVAMRLLLTPEDVYQATAKKGTGLGYQWFTCVTASVERLAVRRLRLRLRLLPGYPSSEPFFWITKGSLRAVPQIFSLEPATVRLTMREDGADYDIVVPQGGGLLRRGFRAMTWPLTFRTAARELQHAHEALVERYEELDRARTELQATQEQLMQASKLAALGRLGAGIAHELNQPIYSILGFAQRVRRHPDEPIAAYVDELDRIVRGAERMARIVEGVGLFSRQAPPSLERIDPLEPLEGALDLVGQQLTRRGIRVTLPERRPPRPTVLGDPVQLEQVFLNLLINARDALGDPSVAEDDRRIRLEIGQDDGFVYVSVEDSGPGVPPDATSRLFDPFYTTKAVGEGTGLGLSISYGIVEQHGGELRHERPPGGGARFVLRLPVARPARSSG